MIVTRNPWLKNRTACVCLLRALLDSEGGVQLWQGVGGPQPTSRITKPPPSYMLLGIQSQFFEGAVQSHFQHPDINTANATPCIKVVHSINYTNIIIVHATIMSILILGAE